MADNREAMNILENPIQHDGRVSMERFYRQFTNALDGVWGENSAESARDCISLCKAAVAGLAAEGNHEAIFSVICHYNAHSHTIGDKSEPESIIDLSVISYGPEKKIDILGEEKARLGKILSTLCEPEQGSITEPHIVRLKYKKTPIFGNLTGISQFYHERYGT